MVYNHNEVMTMTTEQRIRMALAFAGMSQADLARAIGTSPQNLFQRIRRDSLSPAELEQIARAIGGRWEAHIVFDDGTVI